MSLEPRRWTTNLLAALRRLTRGGARSQVPPEVDERRIDDALRYPERATDEGRADDREVLDRVLGRDAPPSRRDGPPPG